MFSYFMQECETNVYDIRKKNNISRLKNADKIEVVSAVVWIMLSITLVTIMVLKGSPIIMAVIEGIMIIEFIVVMGWKDRQWKKKNLELKNQYQEEVIDKLISVMKSSEWKLYNRGGINWAVSMCEMEIQKTPTLKTYLNPIKNYAYYVMLPFLVAIVVKALDGVDMNTVIFVCLTIFTIQLFILGTGYMIYPILQIFFGRKQEFLRRFKEDLMFLLTKW